MPAETVLSPFYKLIMHENYAIVTYFNMATLKKSVVTEVRSHLAKFYQNNRFVLINNREEEIKIDPRFFKTTMPNLVAVAVVAHEDYDRNVLWQEQQNFNKPYAFFPTLDDAVQWATIHLVEI